tara:strand:+ start:389 stop:601 length:213 start_codon:yes stop_codon:yes gene_type:complete
MDRLAFLDHENLEFGGGWRFAFPLPQNMPFPTATEADTVLDVLCPSDLTGSVAFETFKFKHLILIEVFNR